MYEQAHFTTKHQHNRILWEYLYKFVVLTEASTLKPDVLIVSKKKKTWRALSKKIYLGKHYNEKLKSKRKLTNDYEI